MSGFGPDMLGARLGAWLGGRVEGRLQPPLSVGEGESAGEGVDDPGVETEPLATGSTSFLRLSTVCPGSFRCDFASGGGRGMEEEWEGARGGCGPLAG